MRVAVLLVLVATPAVADDARDATRAPGFVTLPLFDATSRAGLDANTTRTIEAHAQLVDEGTGLGAYLLAQDFVAASSGWGQAGALYVVPGSAFESVYLRLVLHAGVETTIGQSGVAAAGGVSVLGRSGDLYWRVDGGSRISGLTPRLLIDGGVGYELSSLALAGELSYGPVEQMPGVPAPPASRSFTAAASARLALGDVQPYAAVATTLDRPILSATAGVELRR